MRTHPAHRGPPPFSILLLLVRNTWFIPWHEATIQRVAENGLPWCPGQREAVWGRLGRHKPCRWRDMEIIRGKISDCHIDVVQRVEGGWPAKKVSWPYNIIGVADRLLAAT